MSKPDDYELYDKDFDEFIRRGLESFGMQDGREQKGSLRRPYQGK